MHEVEVLDGDAGGAFDEVVGDGEDEDVSAGEADGHVAEVGVGNVFGAGEVLDDPDERLALVVVAHGLEKLFFGGFFGGAGVHGREDAAVHGDEVGGEDDADLFAAGVGEDLFDFGGVSMVADAVGGDAFVALGVVNRQLRFAACAGDAGLGVDDDVLGFDIATSQQRGQTEDGGTGVAAGVGDEVMAGDLLGPEFRESVDGGTEASRVGVDVAVPGFVDAGVSESVVGTQVDDFHAEGQQLGDDFHAGGMRQCTEGDLGALGDLFGCEVLAVEIDAAVQRRVDGVNRRGVILTAGDRGDFHVRVSQQDFDQLDGGVAGGSEDGDCGHWFVGLRDWGLGIGA